jgi:N6-adenosine-specific RNA methylase IME4
MAVGDIAAMPVETLAAPDAHLYLWAVPALMAEGYRVVEAWGFTVDTLLTWCKPGPGLGAGWRGNTEHLIVARRGQFKENPTCGDCGGQARGRRRRCECAVPAFRWKGEPVVMRRPFLNTANGSWFMAPRREHSEKPALFADLIERMSPGPYVELFARAPRLGWDSWGKGYEVVA